MASAAVRHSIPGSLAPGPVEFPFRPLGFPFRPLGPGPQVGERRFKDGRAVLQRCP